MSFDKIEKVDFSNALLSYPNFNEPFEKQTFTNQLQLGSVIRKPNSAQVNYTTKEEILLPIVKTPKKYRNILLRQHLKVHVEHKNLTYKMHKIFNTERVIRWRFIIKEYNPDLTSIAPC